MSGQLTDQSRRVGLLLVPGLHAAWAARTNVWTIAGLNLSIARRVRAVANWEVGRV